MLAYREQVIEEKVTSYIKANGSITLQDQRNIVGMNIVKSNSFDNVVQLIEKSGDLFGYFGLFKPSDRVVFSLTGTYISEEQVQWAVACHCASMDDGLVLKRTKRDKMGSLCYMEFTSKKVGSPRRLVFKRSGSGGFTVSQNTEDPNNTSLSSLQNEACGNRDISTLHKKTIGHHKWHKVVH